MKKKCIICKCFIGNDRTNKAKTCCQSCAGKLAWITIREKMIFPSCSEMVFKLQGSLDDIKKEVNKMLDAIIKEKAEYGGDIGENKYNKLRERIKNITNLEDFEKIVFEFTCNYATHFKKKENDLLVATCNNTDWEKSGVKFKSVGGEECNEYHEVSQKEYYDVVINVDGNIVAKDEFGDNKEELIFIKDNSLYIKDSGSVDIIRRGERLYYSHDNSLIEIERITDKELINKLGVLAKL